jgi:hypothetical protein
MVDGSAAAHATRMPPDALCSASTSDRRADANGMPLD